VTRAPRRRAGDPIAAEGGRPIRETFLPFGRPAIGEEEIAAVADVLRGGWIGAGERALAFERAFAQAVGVRHAVATASCTAALHLLLAASRIGPGDEVITTPMTFVATVNAILKSGASPVLADIDPGTLNIDPRAVARAVTRRTRAILPVHFGGLPCDLDGIDTLAREHGLLVVEDAAHAAGARRGGAPVGGAGRLAAFSFYPNKVLTTIDGGMATTDDAALAEEMRLLRDHGLSSSAWQRFAEREPVETRALRVGHRYAMSDVQAALGLVQLARLDEMVAARERIAAIYDAGLSGLPLERPRRPPAAAPDRHALHLYVILLGPEIAPERDALVRALRAENIGAGIHYLAIHRHPVFAETLPYREGDLPVTESVTDRCVTLPIGAAMSEDDAHDVVEAVRSVVERCRRAPRPARC
jgi:dTDP-4-amino-4,6-dideoxygalactose transaminase